MGNCFFKKIHPVAYEYGDFSFIPDRMERRSLEIDFVVLDKELINIPLNDTIKWNTLDWIFLNSQLYQAHTEKTYNRNIKNIEFIKKFGWDCFVRNYPLDFK